MAMMLDSEPGVLNRTAELHVFRATAIRLASGLAYRIVPAPPHPQAPNPAASSGSSASSSTNSPRARYGSGVGRLRT